MPENQPSVSPLTPPANEDKGAFVEQYKLYVEMLEHSTKRRMDTNALFITIHTAMVTIVSLFNKGEWVPLLAVAVAGFAFSLLWRKLLAQYNAINSVKWDVVYDMEQLLPYKPFYSEWYEKLKKPDKKTWRTGNNISETEAAPYISISKLERDILPRVFMGIYIAIGLYGAWAFFNGGANANLATAISDVNDAIAKVNETLAKAGASGIG